MTSGGYVNSWGANTPTVFAHQCSSLGAWSPIWMSCPAGDSQFDNNPSIGALLLQSGIVGSSGLQGGLKGRLNFLSPSDTLPATHLITLGDSNPNKTLATPGHRPTNDPTDTWIGLDNPNTTAQNFQLAFGAPVYISSYIGNAGDNVSWLERLTASAKTFNIPITANQPVTAYSQIISKVASGTAPFQVTSSTPVQNLTANNNATVQSCGGGTTCSPISPLPTAQIVFGTVQLSGGSVALSGITPPFYSQHTFSCVATDTTSPQPVSAVPTSTSSVSFTGHGSDTISYQCVGSETQ